jgi:hypothetical protein
MCMFDSYARAGCEGAGRPVLTGYASVSKRKRNCCFPEVSKA